MCFRNAGSKLREGLGEPRGKSGALALAFDAQTKQFVTGGLL
jgi:hypothetical protein